MTKTAIDLARDWRDWPVDRPEGRALCWWRVAPRMIGEIEWRPEWVEKTLFVGMGHNPGEWWPPMSHWDGYKRTLPAGLQWRPADENETGSLVVPILTLPCPICGSPPKWSIGTPWIGAAPHLANKFSIGCCFAHLKYWEDLPKMVARWNARPALLSVQERLEKAEELLAQCAEACERSYNVNDWPANGDTIQDHAAAAARAFLTEQSQ